jgi:RNA polymerase sigma-70 factor, ECF subfamily
MIKARDKSAFDHLFRLYYIKLRNYAFHITGDIHVAEDIVQTLFFNLWIKPQLLENIKSVEAYLRTSIYNRSISYLKEKQKSNSEFIDLESLYLEILGYQNDQFAEKELSLAIANSLEKLPEQCRLVFKLSRSFGMKNAEIANYLNISIKGVEKHITKALFFLRNELKDYLK